MTVACGALLGTGVTLPVDEASEVLEDAASAVLSGVGPSVVLSGVVASVDSGVEDSVESFEGVGVGVATADVVVSLTPQTCSTSKVKGMFLPSQFLVCRLRASRHCQNKILD